MENRKKALGRLSPRNPLDHLRLLWWALAAPQRLRAYREAWGEEDERRTGKWLASTLIWLPLFIPTLALALGALPPTETAYPPTTYPLLAAGLVVAWSLTGWLGDKRGKGGRLPFVLEHLLGYCAALVIAGVVAHGVGKAVVDGLTVRTVIAVASAVAGIVARVMAGALKDPDVANGSRPSGVMYGVAGGVVLGAAFGLMLSAVDLGVGPSYEVVIAGDPSADDTQAMLSALRGEFFPNKVVLLRPPGESPGIIRLAKYIKNNTSRSGQATAYVCLNYYCELPTTDISQMLELLKKKQ